MAQTLRTLESEASAPPERAAAPVGAVLVVDDEEVVRRSFSRILEAAGYACHAVGSAAEGFAYLETTPWTSVVVSDIAMPGEDGIAFLARLRERFADRPWLQILLVTGEATVERLPGAVQHDASDFLLKPLAARELVDAVGAAFERAERRRALQDTLHSLTEQLSCGAAPVPTRPGMARMASVPQQGGSAGNEGLLTAESVQRLVAWQRRRDRKLGEGLFGDPAWSMLLELYGAELLGLPMPVSSLCIAAETPATTALRRIGELEKAGLVERRPDPADKRRVFVALTGKGRADLESCLEGLLREAEAILASR